MRTSAWLALVGLGIGLWVGAARADMPPPDGRRFVRFSLRISSVDALPPTHRLVLYPIDFSNGAPQPEYRVVGAEDELELGRRAGLVGFYAVPAEEVDGDTLRGLPADAPYEALEAYFSSARVAKAELEARPVGTLDEATLVRVVTHGYAVQAFGADGLVMRHAETLYTYEDGERETVAPDAAPTRSPSMWESPLVWVAAAVAGNAFFAFLVLAFVRRKRDPLPPPG
ncbi:MAG: hypothetical protein H6721_27655 [Sandaracinus sp.]|nr:hypothetical protein [Sandaracinus sp.]MCB9635911.1 hypothetical protein [Sandaracinus sp.]